jgi:hypothetical protein
MRARKFDICHVAWLAACALSVTACGASTATMPPPQPQPTASFAPYQAFELKLAGLPPALAGDEVAQRIAVKVSEEAGGCLSQVLPNLAPLGVSAPAGLPTLVIEPAIEDVRLVRVAARLWVGAMAGDSEIFLRVFFRDKATGAVIADPQFYRGTDAMRGAYTHGVDDNLMLSEIAHDVCVYAAGARSIAPPPPVVAPAPPPPATAPPPLTPAPAPGVDVPSPFSEPSAPAQPAPAPTPAPVAPGG